MRKVQLLIVVALLFLPVQVWGQTPPPWSLGDVFVAVGNGQYKVYHNSGTNAAPNYVLVSTLTDGSGGGLFTTGCTFDSAGNLFTTNYSVSKVYEFSPNSTTPSATIDTTANGDMHNESVLKDSADDLFVGNPDASSVGGGHLLKYDSANAFVSPSFSPTPDARGTDWIDLAADQRTIFYTSEGTKVKRFDVSANSQLGDFATGLPGSIFALRLLPPFDGSQGLLVADTANILRLDSTGTVVQQYAVTSSQTCPTTNVACPTESDWFGLTLDSNGTSFWAQDGTTEDLFRFNIYSGAIEVGPIATAGEIGGGGICVKGQPAASTPPGQPVAPGTSTTFTSSNGIDQTVQIPANSDMGGAAFMQTNFVEIPEATFESTRLPATSPNSWSGGSAVPPGATCTPINPSGNCLLIENRCFASNGTPITPCNIAAPTGSLIQISSHYETSSSQPNPLLAIATDGQNDWANITTSFAGDPTIGGGTGKLNSDEFIGNLPTTYEFFGFFSPVNDPNPGETVLPASGFFPSPAVNTIKAGQTVPLQWQVLRNGVGVTGLTLAPSNGGTGTVSLTGFFSGVCTSASSIETPIDSTTAAGSSGLQDLGGGNYQFNWNTKVVGKGKCVDVVIDPGDGSQHHAYFLTK